ncbi:MAG: putative quinol monooxygenase [Verrucomicrobiota bacterium JB023]|nr:putative quinol monooxygenase [Verrucomicrobiota bacterium JB023]
MNKQLTVVANIHAHPESLDLFKAELEKVIGPTRAEPGCLKYDLHQNNEDPCHFMFFEIWESKELWDQHMESEHIKRYAQATEGAVADFTVEQMSLIG